MPRIPTSLVAVLVALLVACAVSGCASSVKMKPVVGGPLSGEDKAQPAPQKDAPGRSSRRGTNRSTDKPAAKPSPTPTTSAAKPERAAAEPSRRGRRGGAPEAAPTPTSSEQPASTRSSSRRGAPLSPAPATLPAAEPETAPIERNLSAQSITEKGDEHYAAGRYEDARKMYRLAVELQDDYGPAWAGIGRASEKLGEYEPSFLAYRKATTCPNPDPEWASARDAVGRQTATRALATAKSEHKRRNYTAADSSFQQAVDYDRSNPEPLCAWGDSLLERGEFVAALKKYEKARELDPDHKAAWHGVIRSNIREASYDDARNRLDEYRLTFAADSTYRELLAELDRLSPVMDEAFEDLPSRAASEVPPAALATLAPAETAPAEAAADDLDLPTEAVPSAEPQEPTLAEEHPSAAPAVDSRQQPAPAQAGGAPLTREAFAMLLLEKLDLGRYPRRPTPQVVLDISKHPKRSAIDQVLQRNLMEPFPNHTFRPAEVMTRADLAVALAHLFELGEGFDRETLLEMQPVIEDVPSYHQDREAIAIVVALEALSLDTGSAFRPDQPATTAEALQAVASLR